MTTADGGTVANGYEAYLHGLLDAAPIRCGNEYNAEGWCNHHYAELVNKSDTEWNRAKRTALYREAEQFALNRGAWVPLYQHMNHELISPHVHGLVGTETAVVLQPRDGDWANVTVSH